MAANNTRKFDGAVYIRGTSFGEKRVANRVAAKYRARGEKIRTTRSKNPDADITGNQYLYTLWRR